MSTIPAYLLKPAAGPNPSQPGQPGGSPSCHALANQQGSWLRQMELAELAAMQQVGEVRLGDDGPARPISASLTHHAAPTPQQQANAHRQAARDRSDQPVPPATSPRPAQPASHADTTSDHLDRLVGASSAPAPAQFIAVAARMPTAAAVSAHTQAPEIAEPATSASTQAQPMASADQPASRTGTATPEPAPVAVEQPSLNQAAQPALPQASAAPSQPATSAMPRVASNADVPETSDLRAASTTRPLAQRGQLAQIGNPAKLAQGETESASESTASETAEPAHASLAEPADWQKRLMHLQGKDEQVQVWLRDPAVTGHATQTLVYRLLGDLAEAGLRLRSLTVNGKLAFRAPTGKNPPGNTLLNPATGASEPLTSLQEARHGA
ncbi:hypothetical protein [Chitinimonas sp.]|uniref:hypothetical protein n=1 Tax=Chitinimonas sp. TaxID=1934313 RepID=UPI0035B423EC